ncbi:MAG: hypothetical protein EBT13_12000 [Rhodobacteraceae bacterium]|nr:hypothetical protein [Paracoccaceae bacterium]
MKAKITHADGFKIFRNGKTLHFPMGTVVEGYVAEKAVATRHASALMASKRKALKGAPENKAS